MAETYGISVEDYGAVGDGKTDDSPAIQAALDSGAPRVVLPYGTYRLHRGLRIHSDTDFILHPLATLRLADGAGQSQDDFLLTNADHHGGNRAVRIEGGIWDGNNPGNPRGPDTPGSYSGVMINFTNVTGLTLRAARLLDAESYFVRLGKVADFLIEDIAFEIRNLRPNQDGVHVSGHCSDGIIRRLSGQGSRTPNDDLVALLADDALHRAQNLNGAFNGPIRRIRAEQLRARSCHSFIRLLSVDHPIEDIEINDVVGGCRCCAVNMDACRDCRVKLFAEEARPDGVGTITNVSISDMSVFKASDTSRQPLIDFRTHADKFRMERFERDTDRDVSPMTPTLSIEKSGHLDLRLEGVTDVAHGEDSASLASATGGPSFLIERGLTPKDTFTLQSGGFERLKVDKR